MFTGKLLQNSDSTAKACSTACTDLYTYLLIYSYNTVLYSGHQTEFEVYCVCSQLEVSPNRSAEQRGKASN